MSFSLYASTIPSALQMLGALHALIEKAEAFCAEKGIDPASIIGARLATDMHPFSYQVKSACVHSLGAIEGVRRGTFSPDQTTPPDSFAALKARVAETRDALAAIDPAEVDGFVGRDVSFVYGETQRPFTAENFLLSFSQAHFYFHVTTAYALLRAAGMPIGKRDYMGQLRIKEA